MALSESIKQIAIFDECIYHLFSSQFIEIGLKENGFCLLYWTKETFIQTCKKIPLKNHFDANYMTFPDFIIHSLTSGTQCKKITQHEPEFSCLTCDHFYAHDKGILNICVVTFTGFTHSPKLFSCYLNKVTDVSHFSARWRCCISAVTVAHMEAGHCCLPKQTQLQVKSHSHSFYLHSPAASKMLTFSVFSAPFYPDWIP